MSVKTSAGAIENLRKQNIWPQIISIPHKIWMFTTFKVPQDYWRGYCKQRW